MKMPLRIQLLTVIVAVCAATFAQTVHAAFGITSVAGATQLLGGPPAPDVLPGSNEQPVGFPVPLSLPIVFHEVLGGTILPSILHPLGLDVDHNGTNVVASPTISGNVVNPLLVDARLPVGTRFNSYLFHFDPAATPDIGIYISTINFDNPVIGVQLFSAGFLLHKPAGTPYVGTLEQGDDQIAANGGPSNLYYPGEVNYPLFGLDYRGVEEDFFKLAIVGNQVNLVGSASGVEIDQIRILTAFTDPGGGIVPEPASAITWALISLVACSSAFIRHQS